MIKIPLRFIFRGGVEVLEGLHLGVESYILRGEAAALPTPLQHLVEAVGLVLVSGVYCTHLILQGVHKRACQDLPTTNLINFFPFNNPFIINEMKKSFYRII